MSGLVVRSQYCKAKSVRTFGLTGYEPGCARDHVASDRRFESLSAQVDVTFSIIADGLPGSLR